MKQDDFEWDNEYDKLINEEPDLFDDEEEDIDYKDRPPTKQEKKEYYVKTADLIEEIRKYQESRKSSPDRKRIYFRRIRNNGFKNLYKIFPSTKILSLHIS